MNSNELSLLTPIKEFIIIIVDVSTTFELNMIQSFQYTHALVVTIKKKCFVTKTKKMKIKCHNTD